MGRRAEPGAADPVAVPDEGALESPRGQLPNLFKGHTTSMEQSILFVFIAYTFTSLSSEAVIKFLESLEKPTLLTAPV